MIRAVEMFNDGRAGRVLLYWSSVRRAASGCGHETKVTRVDTGIVTDLSGRWNDTDSQMVAEAMVKEALANPWLGNFTKGKNREPVVIVGTVLNKSHEHINVQTFVSDSGAGIDEFAEGHLCRRERRTRRSARRAARTSRACPRGHAEGARARNWRRLHDEWEHRHHFGRSRTVSRRCSIKSIWKWSIWRITSNPGSGRRKSRKSSSGNGPFSSAMRSVEILRSCPRPPGLEAVSLFSLHIASRVDHRCAKRVRSLRIITTCWSNRVCSLTIRNVPISSSRRPSRSTDQKVGCSMKWIGA